MKRGEVKKISHFRVLSVEKVEEGKEKPTRGFFLGPNRETKMIDATLATPMVQKKSETRHTFPYAWWWWWCVSVQTVHNTTRAGKFNSRQVEVCSSSRTAL